MDEGGHKVGDRAEDGKGITRTKGSATKYRVVSVLTGVRDMGGAEARGEENVYAALEREMTQKLKHWKGLSQQDRKRKGVKVTRKEKTEDKEQDQGKPKGGACTRSRKKKNKTISRQAG